MNSDFPYSKFLDIFRECRNTMIADTLNDNSPDLYDALYSNVNSTIHELKVELYELKWIEMHWEKINYFIDKRDCSIAEKKELVSMCAKWYKDFVSNWNYTEFDTIIFGEKMNILQEIILLNSEWEQNIKRMKVSFVQSKKILNEKIKRIEMEELLWQQQK